MMYVNYVTSRIQGIISLPTLAWIPAPPVDQTQAGSHRDFVPTGVLVVQKTQKRAMHKVTDWWNKLALLICWHAVTPEKSFASRLKDVTAYQLQVLFIAQGLYDVIQTNGCLPYGTKGKNKGKYSIILYWNAVFYFALNKSWGKLREAR